jgi:hypothetical protein
MEEWERKSLKMRLKYERPKAAKSDISAPLSVACMDVQGAAQCGRESERPESVNHEVAAPRRPTAFTPPGSVSLNGTEVAETGTWRPFPGNIVVNAIACKGFFGICSCSSKR